MFDQVPDNLRLGKTELPHSSAFSGLGRLYILERDFAGGQVKAKGIRVTSSMNWR